MTKLDVVWTAERQVGYIETGANYNKYAAALDDVTGWYNTQKQGFDWCAIFLDWCFIAAFGVDLAAQLLRHKNTSAGCTQARNTYKAAGALFDSPELGDQVFFKRNGKIVHTGLVVGLDDQMVSTVEGNSGNPGGVRRHSYNRNDSYIAGFGRPDWSVLPTDRPARFDSLEQIRTDAPWAYNTVARLMSEGAITIPNGSLDLSWDMLRLLVIIDRSR